MLRASAARKSLPPCRRCLLGAAGLLLAAAIAIAPGAGRAQAPDADSGTTLPDTNKDLLEPKLQGSPKALPRFRRPGERTPARGDQARRQESSPPHRVSARSRSTAARRLPVPAYRLRFDEQKTPQERRANSNDAGRGNDHAGRRNAAVKAGDNLHAGTDIREARAAQTRSGEKAPAAGNPPRQGGGAARRDFTATL